MIIHSIAITIALVSTTQLSSHRLSDELSKRLGVTRGEEHVWQLPTSREPFELIVDRADGPIALLLEPNSIRSSTYRLFVEDGSGRRESIAPPPTTWRGAVYDARGNLGQVAASITERGFSGLIQFENGRRIGIQPLADLLPGSSRERHVSYDASDALPLPGLCATIEIPHPVAPPTDDGTAAALDGSARVAEIAIEADLLFFQNNGSSIPATQSNVDTLMNAMSLIYELDVGLTYELTALIVQTSAPDDYGSSNSSKLLNEFRDKWNDDRDDIDRDVAHLLSGKILAGNTIGLAFVGVVCDQSFAYGIVETTFTTNLVFRVGLSAHEVGHNWNAPHCDGDIDCSIMCAVLGGCANNVTQFGFASIQKITQYKQAIGCLSKVADVLLPPFHSTFAGSSFDKNEWSPNGGAKVSKSATAEPSGVRSAAIGTSNKGFQDILATQAFDVTGLAVPAFSFYTEGVGLEMGETLRVEYESVAGAWLLLTTVTSSGTSESTFSETEVKLPVLAQHDCVRFRFRTMADEKNDKWYVDDVRVQEYSGDKTLPLLDPSTLEGDLLYFQTGQATPPDAALSVTNRGANVSLPWTASVTEGGTFLAVMPTSGTLQIAEASDAIAVQFNPGSLPFGLHRGVVRITNTAVAGDFVEVPFSFAVSDDRLFQLGSTLTGTIDDGMDTDSASFIAVAGTKAVIAVELPNGSNLKPIVTLLDENDVTIATLKFKNGKAKEKVKFDTTQMVRLVVSGKKESSGDYSINTMLKGGKLSMPRVETSKPDVAAGVVDLSATAVGAELIDVTITPTKDVNGPFAATWTDPSGTMRNLQSHSAPLPTGGLNLRGIPFGTPGVYQLQVSGFLAKESVTVTFNPSLDLPMFPSIAID